MKRFMNFLKRHAGKATALAVASLTVIGLTSAAMAAFGPDRPTKVYEGPGTPGFDHVTFNSFTNVPDIGDERNFLTGKIAGADGGFYDPMDNLRNQDEILMRVYVHNGADPKHNADGSGIAKNTKVRVELPEAGKTALNQSAKAFISADNAQPQEIYDTLDMKAENSGYFALSYVPGSAMVTSNEGTKAIGDEVVAGGVNLGDEKGCFEYVKLITFKVKVIMPNYSIEKTVRKKGETEWKKDITVKPGDEVEWAIEFKNAGSTQLNKVVILDQVPEGTTVSADTIELVNPNNPNGVKFPDALQAAGRQVNMRIGDYLPGSNAFVYFNSKMDPLECGTKTLVNKAFATPEGYGAVTDEAKVTVDTGKECEQPKTIEVCRLEDNKYPVTIKEEEFDETKYSKNPEDCKKVTEEPAYECTTLEAIHLGDWNFRFTTKVKMSEGVTVNKYTYNFGDNSAELNTDKAVVEHKYAAPGEYNVSVRVLFNVGNEQKEARCTAKVTIPKDHCEIPGKEHLPKDSPDCKQNPVVPATQVTPTGSAPKGVDYLPATGPAEIAAGIFGTSATAYGAYAFAASRRTLKNLHK